MLLFVTCDQSPFLYRRRSVVNGVLNTYFGQWPMARTTTSPLTTSELSRALSHANNSPFHYTVVIYRLIPAPPYCRSWVMQTMKAFENSGSHCLFIDPVTIFHCTCRFRLGTVPLLTFTTKGLISVSRVLNEDYTGASEVSLTFNDGAVVNSLLGRYLGANTRVFIKDENNRESLSTNHTM